jgi:YbgC/YbaW family acyl-CoA thioester hydrolase
MSAPSEHRAQDQDRTQTGAEAPASPRADTSGPGGEAFIEDDAPKVAAPGSEAAKPFRIVDRVRWSDVDAAGIVCYGAYLRFVEIAETEFFRATGFPVAEFQEQYKLWLVRRRVEFDFHRSIRLDEEVESFAHVVAIGRTSLELAFAVRRLGDRELAVEARYIMVAVDHDTLRPISIPGPVRAALLPRLLDREMARSLIMP